MFDVKVYDATISIVSAKRGCFIGFTMMSVSFGLSPLCLYGYSFGSDSTIVSIKPRTYAPILRRMMTLS